MSQLLRFCTLLLTVAAFTVKLSAFT